MTEHKPRRTTLDRAPPGDEDETPEIYTVEQLGPKRAYTPNGNLICYDVPIARVGWMLYGADEVDVEVNEQGYCRVYRGEDELFHPKCIGSFMGVAVTDEHPEDGDVSPDTWAEFSRGFSTTNVRRGTGEDADVLLADVIITHQDLIKKVLAGKVEVSAGYDASYIDEGGGVGRQYNIVGNHIAFVERGRCGPRCSIRDSIYQPPEKEIKMPQARVKITPQQQRTRLQRFVDDAQEFLNESSDPNMPDGEQPPGGDDGNGTHIHLHMGGAAPAAADPMDPSAPMPATDNAAPLDPAAPSQPDDGSGDLGNRVAALEAGQKQILAMLQQLTGANEPTGDEADPDAPPPADEGGDDGDPTRDEFPEDLEDKDKEKPVPARTTDSAALATSYRALLSDAEIIFPGFRAPTFDSAAKRTATVDRMCMIRRKVMDHAYATAEGKALIDTITGKKQFTLDSMKCTDVAVAFRSTAAAKRAINNAMAQGDGKPAKTLDGAPKQHTLADINKANDVFWSSQTAHA